MLEKSTETGTCRRKREARKGWELGHVMIFVMENSEES
jgi:hypothetical protein